MDKVLKETIAWVSLWSAGVIFFGNLFFNESFLSQTLGISPTLLYILTWGAMSISFIWLYRENKIRF